MVHRNLWRNDLVAIAYSFQQKAPPYLELVETTEKFIEPKPGQIWLDLGCGSGRLIESIWTRSKGRVKRIIGLDISLKSLQIAKAAIRVSSYNGLIDKVSLVQANLTENLGGIHSGSVDGVTAGLCLSYVEHWNPAEGKWDKASFILAIRELYRALRDGGTLIFSTNVPEPNFKLIALRSWRQILLTWKAPLHLAVSVIMLFQSRWLKRCAEIGRFHYLPALEIKQYLENAGFKFVHYEQTYADQAWVFFAVK